MENSRVLEPKGMRPGSIPRPLKLGLLWVAIVTGFAALGFLGPFGESLRSATKWALLGAAWGAGAATCLTINIWILGRVLKGSSKKSTAVLWLIVSSILGAALTPLAIRLEQVVIPGDFLGGEEHWAAMYVEAWMIMTAMGAFVLFLALVLLARRKQPPPSNTPKYH